jgi:hypothetical protein
MGCLFLGDFGLHVTSLKVQALGFWKTSPSNLGSQPQVIQETFRSTRVTIELMLGSRWPVLAALDSIRSATFSSASLCMAHISDNSTNLCTNYIE